MANHVSIRRDRFRDLIRRFPRSLRANAGAFWVETLFRANWKDSENSNGRDVILLRRGQFPMGRDEMAEAIGLSVREFRTILRRLEQWGELTNSSSNRGSIVTVVNYDYYVDDGRRSDQQIDHETASKRPANGHTKASKGSEAYKEDVPHDTTVALGSSEVTDSVFPVVRGEGRNVTEKTETPPELSGGALLPLSSRQPPVRSEAYSHLIGRILALAGSTCKAIPYQEDERRIFLESLIPELGRRRIEEIVAENKDVILQKCRPMAWLRDLCQRELRGQLKRRRPTYATAPSRLPHGPYGRLPIADYEEG